MDGVRLREVSGYSIETDRRMYRWDVMVGDKQVCYALDDVKPGQLNAARRRARRALKAATASLPLIKGAVYV